MLRQSAGEESRQLPNRPICDIGAENFRLARMEIGFIPAGGRDTPDEDEGTPSFLATPQECDLIDAGQVPSIPPDVKRRVLPMLPAVLRIEVQILEFLCAVRGPVYTARLHDGGEYLSYLLVVPLATSHQHLVSLALNRIADFVATKYGVDLSSGDLRLTLASGEPLRSHYSLLDVIFVAVTSPCRGVHFANDNRLLLLHLDHCLELEDLRKKAVPARKFVSSRGLMVGRAISPDGPGELVAHSATGDSAGSGAADGGLPEYNPFDRPPGEEVAKRRRLADRLLDQ